MSIAIMIVSNEHGNNTVTTIAASKQEGMEARRVLTSSHKEYSTIGKNGKADFCRACEWLSRAYGLIEEHSRQDNERK